MIVAERHRQTVQRSSTRWNSIFIDGDGEQIYRKNFMF